MVKLIVFLLGLAAGGGAATAWLLSEPAAGATPAAPESLEGRGAELKTRFQEALAEGERVGGETEERLRRELDAYRHNPDRALAS